MMWGRKKPSSSAPGRRRARDGHEFLTSGQRRRQRRIGGLSARSQKKVTKQHRAYKKGRRSHGKVQFR